MKNALVIQNVVC